MDTCLIATGVIFVAAVVLVLAVVLWSNPARRPDAEPPRRPRRSRFDFCPACDTSLFPNDDECPHCGLDLAGRPAEHLQRIRIARRQLRRLHEDGLLDAGTVEPVFTQLEHQRNRLLHREPRADSPTTRPAPAVPPPLPPVPRAERPPVETPPMPAESEPAPPPPSPALRRSVAEHLGRFMYERNILWGELAGGLLIVGCSIALVLSLWRTLEALPYFTFLLSAGITSAVFGAGYYTYHHWRLASTSRGLLAIGLLLTPLNLLLLANPGTRGATGGLDIAVKVIAVLAFGGLVRTGARDFVGTDALPGRFPRRWLLALAVVDAPAVLMIPLPAETAGLPAWLALGCFVAAVAPPAIQLDRAGRRPDAAPLEERPAIAVLLYTGLGLFALFAAWGPVLARAGNLPAALRELALPVVVAGSAVVLVGLIVQRRVTEPAGLRAAGTAVALFGMIVLFASVVLAWPAVELLRPTTAVVGLFLAVLAYRDRLPWLYAGAVPALALASLVTLAGTAPAGSEAGPWLIAQITAARGGLVLAGSALVLAALSELFVRIRRPADAAAIALGAAGVAVAGLMLATIRGVEEPELVTATHLACAVGFLAAGFRWPYRVVEQVGVWLLLLASLWALWAVVPGDRPIWGLTIALEALALAAIAVALGQRPVVVRLAAACRDVAAAAALLAPVLALTAAGFPRGAMHTGTLAAVAATALVLATLYRQPAFTWVGSAIGLVALAHLTRFTLNMAPGRLALLAALLAHATLATVGAAVGNRAPRLYRDPLRLTARLASVLAVLPLLFPFAGLAGTWAGLAVCLALIFLATALVWRETGAFAAFQGVLTWAAALAGFAWVEQQPWFAESSLVDPRAVQAYGIALGLLALGWLAARRALRPVDRMRELWAEIRPSVDQLVLGGLIVGHLVAAAAWLLPHALAEVTPADRLAPLPPAIAEHLGGSGGWLLVSLTGLALCLALRWRTDGERADAPVLGLTALGLTVAGLVAARFVPELAVASALRWALATVFLAGSLVMALREPIARGWARLGCASTLSPAGYVGLRSLIVAAGAGVLLLTLPVAVLGLGGRAPAGPLADSVFRDMGWTASVVVPLAALVIGLAGTAVRERSAGFASAGGWVWVLTVAGGYALGITAGGGQLGADEQMTVGLLAVGATAVWALAWLAVERRVPGRGLLTAHVVTAFTGLAVLALGPLMLVIADAGQVISRVGAVPSAFGRLGWLMLALTAAAGYWHAWRARPEYRFHAIGFTAGYTGVLAAALDPGGAAPGSWATFHTLALAWLGGGCLMAVFLFWPPTARPTPSLARRLWPELLAAGLVVLGLRGGWADPVGLVPAGLAFGAAMLVGAVGFAARRRGHEYVSGLLVALAAVLFHVRYGPDTASSFALTVAIGLAAAAWAWTELNGFGLVAAFARVPEEAALDFAEAGRADRRQAAGDVVTRPLMRHGSPWPPFAHVAALLGLSLALFGLIPSWGGADVDSPWLAWAAVLAVGTALAVMLRWDHRQHFALAGLYTLGAAAVALAIAELRPGPVWLDRTTPLALAGYALAVSALARLFGMRDWLAIGHTILAALVVAMGVRTAVVEPALLNRLSGALAVGLLVPAAGLLVGVAASRAAAILRPAVLGLAALALGVAAWAVPDPAGTVPWLNRHAGLFTALTATAALYLGGRKSATWAGDLRRVGAVVGALALATLAVVLVQQIPQFDPTPTVRRTPLDPVAVGTVLVAILTLIGLAIGLALRPDRDPLGPTPHGRTGYVYLAEVLLILLFAHVRLNVPAVFTGQAVRYWTFIVMLLAFIGVGLAELFARRGLSVLARPLLRTGALLPLIPLLVFWAKPPALVFEFADARAPGLRPMLGYLEKLPQHFDVYALLWFLAGLLYGLIALSRRSFGWALLGALATNAGLWALLTHHQVPAAVHPQAWAIPLALIVLVSEHVNRHRLRADVASGLRYLAICMIYVASAADLFIAGVGQSIWLPVVLAVVCLAGVVAGVLLRVRAFLYLGIGFLLLDVFAMIWHAAVDRAQTWVWYASGIVLGALILALFAVLEKRRNDVRELVGRLREWD